MKRIKNKHAFATGLITAAGALICAAVIAAQGFQPRLAISLLLLAAWSAVSLSAAFTQKGAAERAAAFTDERDRYIIQRSSHAALMISGYLMFGACFIGLVLYGVFKYAVFLTISATLCAALIAMFAALLCANIWFEKHG